MCLMTAKAGFESRWELHNRISFGNGRARLRELGEFRLSHSLLIHLACLEWSTEAVLLSPVRWVLGSIKRYRRINVPAGPERSYVLLSLVAFSIANRAVRGPRTSRSSPWLHGWWFLIERVANLSVGLWTSTTRCFASASVSDSRVSGLSRTMG